MGTEVERHGQSEATRMTISIVSQSRPKVKKRSRTGCRNCKIRSIKCDETQPRCKKCLSYGIQCNFVKGVSDMQLAVSAACSTQTLRSSFCSVFAVKHDTDMCKEAAALTKFRHSVAMTVSLGKRLSLFQNEIVYISKDYPALKHTIIALTLMHTRHDKWQTLKNPGQQAVPRLSVEEANHWYVATRCFNRDLVSALTNTAKPGLDVQRQAALCATSMLLVALSFCYVEATTPEEAWPMKGGSFPSNFEDLQWMKMSNGKLSAQALTKDLKTDPIYYVLVHIDDADKSAFSTDAESMGSNAHIPQSELEQLLLRSPEAEAFVDIANSKCVISIVFSFWSFVGCMTAEFEYCLRHKEPSALLTLLYWYAKLNPLPLWWLKARTLLEGRAICAYLQKYHGHDSSTMSLLRWPMSILTR